LIDFLLQSLSYPAKKGTWTVPSISILDLTSSCFFSSWYLPGPGFWKFVGWVYGASILFTQKSSLLVVLKKLLLALFALLFVTEKFPAASEIDLLWSLKKLVSWAVFS
jgi:hypothetical protein